MVLSSPWTQDKHIWNHLPSCCPPASSIALSNPSGPPATHGTKHCTQAPSHAQAAISHPHPQQGCIPLLSEEKHQCSSNPCEEAGSCLQVLDPNTWLKFTAWSPGQPGRQSLSPSLSNAEQLQGHVPSPGSLEPSVPLSKHRPRLEPRVQVEPLAAQSMADLEVTQKGGKGTEKAPLPLGRGWKARQRAGRS